MIRLLTRQIEEAAEIATQIAVSSGQQLAGMDEVALAMEHVKAATNENAESTNQLEAEAQNLSNLGTSMKDTVGLYTI